MQIPCKLVVVKKTQDMNPKCHFCSCSATCQSYRLARVKEASGLTRKNSKLVEVTSLISWRMEKSVVFWNETIVDTACWCGKANSIKKKIITKICHKAISVYQ